MKREIKFRGKRIDSGEWIIGDLIINRPTQSFKIMHDGALIKHGNYTADGLHCFSGYVYYVDKNTVGQFTGLKDKNGVEIYEGDIIRYYQPHSKTFHTHIVRWDDLFACFGLFKQDSKWCVESDWLKIEEIKVVGNIHDNPELLK